MLRATVPSVTVINKGKIADFGHKKGYNFLASGCRLQTNFSGSKPPGGKYL